MNDQSVVYVLTNPAMPGLVKIGIRSQTEVKARVGQLYSTGVPVPFDIEYAAKVEKADEVEKAMHTAFAPDRINPKREFFKIEPEQAIAILRLLQTEDTTTDISEQTDEVDTESRAAGEQLRKRRPNLNFNEMGIPIQSILHFTRGDSTVTVTGSKKVVLAGEEMSLTAATRQLSETDYDLPPALYWTYEGRLLREIYNETYDIE